MSDLEKEKNRLLQIDWRERIANRVGTEQWFTAYEYVQSRGENYGLFSALLPPSSVDHSLKNDGWDLRMDGGMPGFTQHNFEGAWKTTYYRFGNDEGIEPLVMSRNFHGVRASYLEVSEEFRHYHNLFHDIKLNKFYKFDDAGDEEEVVEITDQAVKIKLKHLRQFTFAKNMVLAFFFDIDRWSTYSLEQLGLKPERSDDRAINTLIHLAVDNWDFAGLDTYRSFSKIMGKKLILPSSVLGRGVWPDEEQRKFSEFIVGTDEHGAELSHSCDPADLGSLFLRPIFFRREVLAKYYSQPETYSVEDGYLRCGSLWGLPLDNNHDKFIVVFLGDLGESLTYKEQLYWRSFNVVPDGTISRVQWKRGFMAEATNPDQVDLRFKFEFRQFQRRWAESFGWPLFLPLGGKDEHFYKILRVPLTDDQAEFDNLVLALAKTIVDSLNEKELEKQCSNLPKDTKGIGKLECFCKEKEVAGYEVHISFLKKLYGLRSSGVGHRKGDNYEKAAANFDLSDKNFRAAFGSILESAIELLKFLDQTFLPPNKN